MATDNIFDAQCGALVNTINCVGVMGGGLAKAFRERYPLMNEAYQLACARGKVQVGKMWSWHDRHSNRWIINFPTKDDWRHRSEMTYIVDGLKDLRLVIDDLRLESIAIPALGCGLGGLKWADVQPLMHERLTGAVATTRIYIYPPTGERYTL